MGKYVYILMMLSADLNQKSQKLPKIDNYPFTLV